MTDGIEGKRILITAAATGIGRAIAEAFVAQGASVHVCDVDTDALDALRGDAPDLGATRADVTDAGDVDRLFDAAEADLGGLDVLVNNAGIAGPTGPVESLSTEKWTRTIDVNLNGAFLCLRRAVPLIKRAGGGSIVNIASTAGIMGYPLRTPYASSKWALVGLTKSLAMELGPYGIRVNAICPGPVEGERIDRVIAADARARGIAVEVSRDEYLRMSSMRTFIDREEIAATAVFLCSDAGRHISGQALAVDGHTEALSKRT